MPVKDAWEQQPYFSQITDTLYISAFPQGYHAEEIHDMGIRLILSMHWQRPDDSLGLPPVELLWLPTYDNWFIPMSMRKLQQGVEAALPVMAAGHGVLSHCVAGVHRSVAMACCVLIGQGYTANEAMKLVKERRPIADPGIWYIQRRIRRFEQLWNNAGH
jgi:protein tyrosine phosphatase (PTP) superfamily phosphohydrolase (DUF442 family)